jgi:CheY-like chemotaxis protein
MKRNRNPTILLIEDKADEAFVLMKMLYHILPDLALITLSSEAQVGAYLANPNSNRPALVLLDLYFPTKQGGLRVLVDVKDYFLGRTLAPVPVIMLSNSREEADIRLCYDSGVNAYMAKPPTIPQLSSFLEYWLKTVTIPI